MTTADRSAVVISPQGITYRVVLDVLFGPHEAPPAMKLLLEDGAEPMLCAQAVARGKGKTRGFHERQIRVSRKGAQMLRSATGRSSLGRIARSRDQQARDLRNRGLRSAICCLVQGGPEKLDLKDPRCSQTLSRYTEEVDEVFFEALFSGLELKADDADRAWGRWLWGTAARLFEAASNSLPVPESRKYKAYSLGAEHLVLGAFKALPHGTVSKFGDAIL